MGQDEIMDTLAHEFLLVSIKRQLDECEDKETLRHTCLQLVDMIERQKAMFKQLLFQAYE
jgi:hypothetical protein